MRLPLTINSGESEKRNVLAVALEICSASVNSTYENAFSEGWQRVRESNPCTSLERAVS